MSPGQSRRVLAPPGELGPSCGTGPTSKEQVAGCVLGTTFDLKKIMIEKYVTNLKNFSNRAISSTGHNEETLALFH